MIIYRSQNLRDAQQDPVVAMCAICEGEQYQEDVMYLWDGKKICGQCMQEKFDCLTIKEKADLLGAECVKAGE